MMNSASRPLSSYTYSQLLYQDDHDEILKISQVSGREPAEEIRDLISEALNARRIRSMSENKMLQVMLGLYEQNRMLLQQNNAANERQELLLKRSELLEDRWDNFKRGLTQNLREFYAILLENLSASIAAKNLVWNYVARVILESSGFTKEQMERKYQDELKASIKERENIVDALEEAMKNIPFVEEEEGDIDAVGRDLRPEITGGRG